MNDRPVRVDERDLDLDALAKRAADGDRESLSALLHELQHPMYRLALRFLGHPQDAQDATQEILIRLVTHLGSFEGRSKFTTWAYTVATRSLLRTRRRFVESSVKGPEQFAAFLDAGLGDIDPTIDEAEYRLLCDEVRISCTYGMLLCVPRDQRLAYLLADVIGLTDVEGAEILECSREAFRQRVSRARRTIRYVVENRCGLVDPGNPCRCGRQIASSERAGILRRDSLPLARHPREEVRVWIEPLAKQLDDVVAIGDLYRFDRFKAPDALWIDLQSRFPELLGAQ
ncbi:MAG TPA: RNA polymerase sigma factor [Acidimicrobiales bacterium]|jgi:RNA polymerase sigma factor (sigma-70 family)|nr:RNA polymerase sigma factor [Acidimicrobiales bacterium]